MLVSKPTHGGGAPLGIDLDGGVAKIRIKAKPAPPVEADPVADEPADTLSADPTNSAGPTSPANGADSTDASSAPVTDRD